MSTEFVTVPVGSEKSTQLLTGTFDKSKRAVLAPSFTKGFQSRQLTFKIEHRPAVRFLDLLFAFAKSYRPSLLILTMGPILSLWIHFYFMRAKLDIFMGVLASVGLFLIHGATFYFNDYFDYIKGSDSSQGKIRRRVLNESQFPAYWIRNGAYVLSALGLLVAIPIFTKAPWLLLLALGGMVAVLGYSAFGKGLKGYGLGELAVFFALGPMLAVGFAHVLVGTAKWDVIGLGIVNGFVAVLYVQHRNFQSLWADSDKNVRTFMVRLGFDRSKFWLTFTYIFNLAVLWGINFYFLPEVRFLKPIGSGVFFLIYCALSLWYFKKMRKVQSPLSSKLQALTATVLGLSLIVQLSFLNLSFALFGFMRRVPFTTKLDILAFLNKAMKFFGL